VKEMEVAEVMGRRPSIDPVVPWRHYLRTMRGEILWLPGLLTLLCAALVLLNRAQPANARMVVMIYLEVLLPPLTAWAASSLLVSDPTLELHLTAPRQPRRTLLERYALLLGAAAAWAPTMLIWVRAWVIPIAPPSGWLHWALVWAAPTTGLSSLAGWAALAGRSPTVGAMAATLPWSTQLVFREWFMATPTRRTVFLFLSLAAPGSPQWPLNRAFWLTLGVVFLALSLRLLRDEERYVV
jgi:hypothetical protein